MTSLGNASEMYTCLNPACNERYNGSKLAACPRCRTPKGASAPSANRQARRPPERIPEDSRPATEGLDLPGRQLEAQLATAQYARAIFAFLVGLAALVLFGQWGSAVASGDTLRCAAGVETACGSPSAAVIYGIGVVIAVIWFLVAHNFRARGTTHLRQAGGS